MDSKKAYELLLNIKATLNEKDSALVDKILKGYVDEREYIAPHIESVANALRVVKEEVMKDGAKKTGKSTVRAAMMKILKNSQREDLKKAWIENGRLVMCDGISVVVKTKYDGIDVPVSSTAPFSIDNLLARDSFRTTTVVETPSILAVKTALTEAKKGNSEKYHYYVYRLSEDVYVDARFLITMLEAMSGDCVVSVGGYSTPVKFENESGEGHLCPVRVEEGSGRYFVINA